jgi:hypothetical protein
METELFPITSREALCVVVKGTIAWKGNIKSLPEGNISIQDQGYPLQLGFYLRKPEYLDHRPVTIN